MVKQAVHEPDFAQETIISTRLYNDLLTSIAYSWRIGIVVLVIQLKTCENMHPLESVSETEGKKRKIFV